MSWTITIAAVGLLVVSVGGQLLIQRWCFRRFANDLLEEWNEVISEHGLERVDGRGLMAKHSRHWREDLDGRSFDLVLYKKVLSRSLREWKGRAILQMEVDPGSIRVVPESSFAWYWEIGDPSITSTNLDAFMDWYPEETEPVEGASDLCMAGDFDRIPDGVRRAFRHLSSRGHLWISDRCIVLNMESTGWSDSDLRRALDELETVADWLQ